MKKEILQSVILEQQSLEFSNRYLNRITGSLKNNNEIVVLSGIRRCGKSTLLHEIRSLSTEKNYYLNFDDERLVHFKMDDFQNLYELFIEMFGQQKTFYFDEIQNVNGWERFVRRLHDYGNKIYVTGSNASMLSRELGTHLTGRYYQYELFPFSFEEYIRLKGNNLSELNFLVTKDKALIKSIYNEYFYMGGFPAYLQNSNKDYLKSLYQSILYRDVLVRNNITSEKELLELVYFLASNIAKPSTYSSLAKVIGVKNATTISNYLGYLHDTYLIFVVNKFDFSLKKQLQNPKKTYFIDIALTKELGFHTSDDKGRLLENLVFIELKRRGLEVYYHLNKHECDFVIKEKNKITECIQVCWSLPERETKSREFLGLAEAMELYNLNTGLLLTDAEEDSVTFNNKTIIIKPVWKWMLEHKSNYSI